MAKKVIKKKAKVGYKADRLKPAKTVTHFLKQNLSKGMKRADALKKATIHTANLRPSKLMGVNSKISSVRTLKDYVINGREFYVKNYHGGYFSLYLDDGKEGYISDKFKKYVANVKVIGNSIIWKTEILNKSVTGKININTLTLV